MKIKISLLLTFCMYASISTYAQTSDEEAEAMINLLGVQKKEAVAKLVPVTGQDSVTFWKIYEEYQKENKANAKSRIRLYESTAQAYSNMTPAIADSLAKQYFVNRSDQEKSLEVYYKKIKTAINPIVAFEFYQAETFLLTQVRASIMRQIPTYGELRMAAKGN